MLTMTWIEVPVKDIERALKFYQHVFELPAVTVADDGVRKTAILINPTAEGQVGYSLNQTANFEPSKTGTLPYFHVGKEVDLAPYLERVTSANGQINTPKTPMDAAATSFYALIEDTEGNLFALSAY